MTTAYTIGTTKSYDKALRQADETGIPLLKMGKGSDPDDPNYKGGWVWASLVRATDAAHDASSQVGATFSVYELEIPGTWKACTCRGSDGEFHLLVDARIIRKVSDV